MSFKVVHYINQFFANIGGEEMAHVPPEKRDGFVGPGMAFNQAWKGEAEIVNTIVCGDSYFAEHEKDAKEQVLNWVKEINPDLFIAGPAFNAGRYGYACATICKAVQDELGIKVADITAEMLGTAKSVTITKDNTTIVDGAGSKEDIAARVAAIKGEMEHTDSEFDREKLQERLAKLSGGVAVIKVGAATETELKEIKHRVEDALQATRAAVEEGIVAGGGVAFMDALPALNNIEVSDPEEQIGIDIIKKALTAPVATIAKNAGYEGAVIVDKVSELPAGEGLNSANGEWGNMIEMGVLDPVKVTRTTLQNAASVASLILITEATVTDVPKNTQLEDAIAAATAGAQGGGMY